MLLRLNLISIFLLFGSVAFGDELSDYRLGSGDKISIQVYGEEDLSLEIGLSDVGTFAYPFLGDIFALGKTPDEVRSQIIAGLKGDYLIDPKVNVSIVEYRSFFIDGEVSKPGGYPYLPGLSLQKAIALAGGFTERASRSKIKVIREVSGKTEILGLEDSVSPGDIVTVEQSFF
tara:strand:+ start:97265 stop:97786 length:522 start_codon:yes stop_codon:yes gene_type:complete